MRRKPKFENEGYTRALFACILFFMHLYFGKKRGKCVRGIGLQWPFIDGRERLRKETQMHQSSHWTSTCINLCMHGPCEVKPSKDVCHETKLLTPVTYETTEGYNTFNFYSKFLSSKDGEENNPQSSLTIELGFKTSTCDNLLATSSSSVL